MAQFVVRNIEQTVKASLRRRAQRNGRSMEEEVRDILRAAVRHEDQPAGGLGTAIAAQFRKSGLRSDLPELRGDEIKPALFES